MPIAVDYTATIDDVTIKCSKPFNELGSITVDDLLPYAISGIYDIGVGRAGLSCEAFGNYTDIENNTPIEYINSAWSDVRVKYHTEYNPFRANPHYGFTILAYGTEWQCINSTTDDTRLVLDIPIQKIFVDMPTYSKQTINKVNDGDASTIDSIDWYSTSDTGKIRTVSNNTEISNLQILTVFVLSDSNFIIMNTTGQKGAPFVHTTYAWHGNTGNAAGGTSGTTVFLPYYSTTYLSNTARYVNMANDEALNNNAFGNVDWSRNFVVLFDTPDNEREQTNSYVVVTYTGAGPPDFNGTVTFYPKGGERAAMLGFANSCLKFKYGNTMYKPLISGGAVYDYTDDMTAESEFDDITNVTGNNVPLTPPAPPEEDDESDDQASGGIYGGAQGMCNLYYMTAGEIKDLQNWFRGTVFAPGIQIPADFDPSNQLIGLMAFPIELGGSVDSTTITFRTADNQSVDTGVSCQKAYGDDLKFDLGTIDIPARMQQRGVPFLDYSCQVEVYIPFCDVVQLDVQQVIGTTLKCEMWISPATGDVSAMLSSGTHPVAYTSGNCAQQLPISVSSYGAIAGAKAAAQNRNTQAVFQAAQNVVKDITNAGAIGSAISNHTAVNGQGLVEFSRIPQVQNNTGLAVGAGIKAAGTMVNTALQLTAQNFDNRYALQVAKNSAPTHVSGSFGACTSWHFPNYCYVKITRPHFQKPDNYGHTEAVPVVATKKLSKLSGLTTCVNPDVSGIGTATMQELETIKSYLMSGVIL